MVSRITLMFGMVLSAAIAAYFRYFSRCGFNLYRFSQQNCSYRPYRDLDYYLVQEGIMTDELLCCARKYGLRIFYGFPLNPQEWRGTDGDGTGDNADLDRDSDGWSDKEENRAGTNPLDRLSFPK